MSNFDQLLMITQKDAEVLVDCLSMIKKHSSRKADRKNASETIIKLDKMIQIWDPSVERKQVALRPPQLRIIAGVRDVYNLDLSPQLKNWQVPE